MANRNGIDIVINAITSGFTSNLSRMNSAINSTAGGLQSLTKTIVGLGAVYAGVTGMKALADSFIETSKSYEVMKASLTASVGAENTEDIWKGLQEFAKETPYSLEEVQGAYTRMMNLGIKPSSDALKAYGNIVAATPNKKLTDFVEAVADSLTGENERLKEFGIVARKVGTDGKKLIYTFQGIPTEVDNNKDAINEYLIATAKLIAGNKAMELQAATLQGRLSALSDSWKQFQEAFMNNTGASAGLASLVKTLSDAMDRVNLAMNSGELKAYWDSFKEYIQPVITIVNDLIGYFTNLDQTMASSTGGSFLAETWDTIVSFGKQVAETIMLVVQYLDEMGKNGGIAQFGKTVMAWLDPVIDIIKRLWNGLKDGFNTFTEWLKFLGLGENQAKSFASGLMNAFKGLPAFLSLIVNNIISSIKFLAKQFAATFTMIGGIIINFMNGDFSLSSMKKEFGNMYSSMGDNLVNFGDEMGKNSDKFKKSIEDTDKELAKLTEKSNEAMGKAVEARNKQNDVRSANDIKRAKEVASAKFKIEHEAAKNTENMDKKTNEVFNKLYGKAPKPDVSGAAAGGKKAGAAAAKAANQEAKKALDYQLKLEEDRYKQGEYSAKEYYDKVLTLKLQSLNKENTATSKAYQDNLNIINDTTSTEDAKKKALEANTALQSKMNSMTDEEKTLRLEISNQLRDANKEFMNNINNIQKELNNITWGTDSVDDAMKDFENKYAVLRKRIAAEDAANATSFLPKLDQLQAVTKAMAEVKQSQAELNVLEAQYEENTSRINYQVASGDLSNSDAKKQQIQLTKELTAERVKFLENEVRIAEATQGYNKVDLANLKTKLNEYKIQSIQLSDTTKSIADSLESAVSGAFDSIIDGSKSFGESLKDIFKSISSSLVGTLTKGWGEQLAGILTSSSSSGAGGGGGLFSAIGNAIGGLFGGNRASGGIMKPNSIYRVNETGQEYFYNGSKPTNVMTAAATEKMYNKSNTGGNTIIMNIKNNDANSFRKSENQIMTSMQQKINRAINRTT